MREPSKGEKIAFFASLGLTMVVVAGVAAVWLWRATRDVLTTQSLSPDGRYSIHLIEIQPNHPLRLDRNFRLELVQVEASGEPVASSRDILFESPDEGPAGTERFIWSKDGMYVLLVGREFFVDRELPTAGEEGEHAYLLYHVPTRRLWVNARQISPDQFEPLTEHVLREIEFAEPVLATE